MEAPLLEVEHLSGASDDASEKARYIVLVEPTQCASEAIVVKILRAFMSSLPSNRSMGLFSHQARDEIQPAVGVNPYAV